MEKQTEYKIQDLVDNWWEKSDQVKRGSIIQAFIPHVDFTPYLFEPIGRTNPREHNLADVIVKPAAVGQPQKEVTLPVAGMPKTFKGECWSAYRSKVRPCLVLSTSREDIQKSLTRKMAGHSTAQTFTVAPYYGIASSENRSGYRPEFVERIRHIHYRQFFYEELPHIGGEASILRFDHIMPIGAHSKSYKNLGYCLSKEAMNVMDDYISWVTFGGVPDDENSMLLLFKDAIG